jgi:hypothetical protein
MRKRSALDGKQPKLSWTVAMDVMPASTAALTSNSLGFIASLAPTTALRARSACCLFRYPSQPNAAVGPSPFRSQDDMLQKETGASSWTL